MEKIDEVEGEDNQTLPTIETDRREIYKANQLLPRQASDLVRRNSDVEDQNTHGNQDRRKSYVESEIVPEEEQQDDEDEEEGEDPMIAVREMLKKQAEMRAKLFARQQAAL